MKPLDGRQVLKAITRSLKQLVSLFEKILKGETI